MANMKCLAAALFVLYLVAVVADDTDDGGSGSGSTDRLLAPDEEDKSTDDSGVVAVGEPCKLGVDTCGANAGCREMPGCPEYGFCSCYGGFGVDIKKAGDKAKNCVGPLKVGDSCDSSSISLSTILPPSTTCDPQLGKVMCTGIAQFGPCSVNAVSPVMKIVASSYGSNCSKSEDCNAIGGLECLENSDNNTVCMCSRGKRFNNETHVCMPTQLDDPCDVDSECPDFTSDNGPKAKCLKNVCKCPTGFTRTHYMSNNNFGILLSVKFCGPGKLFINKKNQLISFAFLTTENVTRVEDGDECSIESSDKTECSISSSCLRCPVRNDKKTGICVNSLLQDDKPVSKASTALLSSHFAFYVSLCLLLF